MKEFFKRPFLDRKNIANCISIQCFKKLFSQHPELKSIDERRPSSSCQPPSSALLVRKAMSGHANKTNEATASICTTFSRDSGIDSMNAANSPGITRKGSIKRFFKAESHSIKNTVGPALWEHFGTETNSS